MIICVSRDVVSTKVVGTPFKRIIIDYKEHAIFTTEVIGKQKKNGVLKHASYSSTIN